MSKYPRGNSAKLFTLLVVVFSAMVVLMFLACGPVEPGTPPPVDTTTPAPPPPPGPDYSVADTAWSFNDAQRFGPGITDPQVAAALGVGIWRGGEWLTRDGNEYAAAAGNWRAKYYNTVTVTSPEDHWAGRVAVPRPEAGRVVTTQTPACIDGCLHVQRGTSAFLYGTPTWHPVEKFDRTVAYMPDHDVFVVVDWMKAPVVAATATVRWHTQRPPAITSGSTFTLTGPSGVERCYASVVGESIGIVSVEAVVLGPGGTASSHAVTYLVSQVNNLTLFDRRWVTVFDCGADSVPAAATAEFTATGVAVTTPNGTVYVPNDITGTVTR